MAEFYVSIAQKNIALQIATLLNSYNSLHSKRTAYSILKGKVDYFVEVIHDKIVGCAGLEQKYPTLSEIKHICIAPNHRRTGIAKKLVRLAISNSKTGYVYMTIRSDNRPSLMTAKSLGFVFVRKDQRINYYLVTVGRKKDYASQ